jgi:hypothetical protein
MKQAEPDNKSDNIGFSSITFVFEKNNADIHLSPIHIELRKKIIPANQSDILTQYNSEIFHPPTQVVFI